jgi:hypothetical protein
MAQVLLIPRFLDTGGSTLKDPISVSVQILKEYELCDVLHWLAEIEKGLWITFCIGVQASMDKLLSARHGAQK